MFVLALNHFQKCFFVNAGVWLCMENGFSEKEFQLTVKLRPLTWKIFSAKILPSNNFRRHAKRERKRERTHTRKHREREREREREIANPETQDHRTTGEIIKPEIVELKKPKIVALQVAPSQSHRRVAPLPISFSFLTQISSASPISLSRSHRTNDLVVVSLSLKF